MMGYIYLIHFVRPYKHAKHYLGWTQDLSARLTAHRTGNGSRLMAVVTRFVGVMSAALRREGYVLVSQPVDSGLTAIVARAGHQRAL